jgi:hypothetical protein
MKMLKLFILLVMPLTTFTQQLPNGNFEEWEWMNNDWHSVGWEQIHFNNTVQGHFRDSMAYQGKYALHRLTWDYFEGNAPIPYVSHIYPDKMPLRLNFAYRCLAISGNGNCRMEVGVYQGSHLPVNILTWWTTQETDTFSMISLEIPPVNGAIDSLRILFSFGGIS